MNAGLRAIPWIAATAVSALATAGPLVARAGKGVPDLSGTWRYDTMTPLQRPAEFTGKPAMTDDEAARFVRERLRHVDADRPRRDADAEASGAGVNEFWMDRGPLARIGGTRPTSLIVDPPDGLLPAVAAGAAERRGARARDRRRLDGPEALSLAERCLRGTGGPPLLPEDDSSLVEIVQTSGDVLFVQEWAHQARIVPLAGQPHAPAAVRSWTGDPRGRWDGETLVVDSTNFRALDQFDENLHLIERFTRTSDDTLLYEFTVDDPTAYSRPWSVSLPMRGTRDRIFEFACHEGNYALTNMLRGARFQEQRQSVLP